MATSRSASTSSPRLRRAGAPDRGNSGVEGAIVMEKIRENTNPNFGFNAADRKYEDLVSRGGVIDPTKVTRSALQNAASIAR
jgi:chaperonin GroEL